MWKLTHHIAAVAISLTTVQFVNAQVNLGQVDDFSAVSAAGWREGASSANPPTHNNGLGFDGNAGHLQNISDGGGSGGRWLMWNDDARWSGDYLSEGVSSIVFDFNNLSGNGVDANVRIGFDGIGGWFVSNPINIADGSGWQTVGFELDDLTHVAASGGSGLLNDTLGTVSRFEILSSVNTPSFAASGDLLRGDSIVADFRIDNISAVPEPSAGLFVLFAVSGFCIKRSRT
jgi:hypothetical protein